MSLNSAREHLGSSTSGYISTKARFIAGHISQVHPDRPVIVVGRSDCLRQHFVAALGHSGDRKLFLFKKQDDVESLAAFKSAAKPFAGCSSVVPVPTAGTSPPILLASHDPFCIGIDGLQVGPAATVAGMIITATARQ